MSAFVSGVGGSAVGHGGFVGASVCGLSTPTRSSVAVVRMGVIDRLDSAPADKFEQTKQVYTFSRYILGPHTAIIAKDGMSADDKEVLIRQAIRQVFGNAYLMEEEREELQIAESQFKNGAIPMKDFIRALAKSSAYQTRFLEGAVQYRFIELNFKHLLGRAPDNHEEIAKHMRTYQQFGFEADIDSYLDDGEYDNVFGYDTIPFMRFRGVYTPCDSFNRQCALQGGWANSDKAMGGAALSGYNGADGRQMSTLISTYAAGKPVDYSLVAANTPLKTTAPNWYALPNPALPPMPSFVSPSDVNALKVRLNQLQAAYAKATERSQISKDTLEMWRSAAKEMQGMRGYAPTGESFFGGISQSVDNTPLASKGQKSSDYKRFSYNLYSDEVSRLETEIEETKSTLRVLEAALSKSTAMTPVSKFPGLKAQALAVGVVTASAARPRITGVKPKPIAPVAAAPKKLGGLRLPSLPKLPSVSLPSLPKLPSLPFGKK
uniref:PBS-linker domain-containing protein n=1 Tax=Timspurckia oligopyrenoides TaxID=708627 RepID=A0A7S0ZGR9_9RHOD|mmetsp:Transcript_452/g.813  ORF Transcript_452/g.813 Transcript_452/m.813 type:complete len:491 (+) Transcript_452:73-1545(+)|eukprot:CAMPEP_0182446744 /NCGR_PEP_ID=MMETSP1172-20130603/5616_1 /TAXON_ID=708627 /ORGANISM="Timspurckia oligopyrenoides, Strain CCMP3278" /LENGTH=490 /DNA_ID=CAMNT_0024642779 /DNA_START=31 /DNA_END=1503 /DNA_ORIENTATION=-